MTTATLTDVIDKMIAVVKTLTPTQGTDRRFDRSPQDLPLRDWALENGAADAVFRAFEVLDEGPREDPPHMAWDVVHVERDVTVTVAYPVALLGLYGVRDLEDMEDLVEEDARQIRDALMSPTSLANGGHQANQVEITDLDRTNDEMWFQVFAVHVIYFATQTLT